MRRWALGCSFALVACEAPLPDLAEFEGVYRSDELETRDCDTGETNVTAIPRSFKLTQTDDDEMCFAECPTECSMFCWVELKWRDGALRGTDEEGWETSDLCNHQRDHYRLEPVGDDMAVRIKVHTWRREAEPLEACLEAAERDPPDYCRLELTHSIRAGS